MLKPRMKRGTNTVKMSVSQLTIQGSAAPSGHDIFVNVMAVSLWLKIGLARVRKCRTGSFHLSAQKGMVTD